MRWLLIFGVFLPLWWACSPAAEVPQERVSISQLLLEERFAEAADSLEAYGAGTQVPGNTPQEACMAYYRARITYQEGDFPRALEQARRALPGLLRHADGIDPGVLIQCMHLLAELHFDHIVHEDSVGIYQRWAADLIAEETPPAIRAENQLCRALDQLSTYTFSTQVAAARLGRSLLDELPRRYPDKYARLLVAEGLGLKKYADAQPDTIRQKMLEEAAALLGEAARMYRATGSIRWREAQREKVIIVSRFGDRARFERELAPLLLPETPDSGTATAPASPPPFGFPDRLRGYFHHQATGNVDSVLHYYLRFQPQAPAFDFHLQDETHWTLIQYGLRRGDLRLAERNIRDQLVLYDCCSADAAEQAVGSILPALSPKYFCKYPLADFGRVRLAEYRRYGRPGALEEARLIFDHILSEWETIFTTGEEESAVAQLNHITSRIVTTANEVAWLSYLNRPDIQNADRQLRTLERTKSFLLLKDRLEDADAPGSQLRRDSLRRWQSEINVLKEQEMRRGLGQSGRLRLLRLSRQHQEANARAREERLGIYRESGEGIPTVRELRTRLGPAGAALLFAEGDGRLLAQYIDADTVVVYGTVSLDTLAGEVDAFVKRLESPPGSTEPNEYATTAHRLFMRVLGPVADRLGGRRNLLVVPAGPLQRLPFGALVTGRGATTAADWAELPYLVHEVTISYAPSLRVERLNQARRMVEWGTATVGSWVHPGLTHYFGPAARQRVAAAPAGSTYFGGSDCRAATFQRRSANFGILDFALHATGDPSSAYRNYLHFAPGDSLNGAAIARQDCRARLVLLTACQTGLGERTVAEGTFSIARSFQQLGVPDVVYSLWRIPAAASAELQERFYHHLYRGGVPAEALARAQRELAAGQRRSSYAYPGNWAGLVKG